jgi:radical SAM protein with 4Fe4S-binding SPASM domain
MDRGILKEDTWKPGLRPPRALTLAITGICNLTCGHCLVEGGPKAREPHVPADTVRRIVSEFAALGGEEIYITGGEPLLHPRWLDILTSCCDQRSFTSVVVQTNAALLGDARVRAMRALQFEGLAIQVSLDGSSPHTHDRVRGRGTFVRSVDGIRRLRAAGLGGRVSVAFTEMRHNMEDIPALLELVEELGLRRLVSGTLVKQGRAAATDVAPPTPEQYRALLSRYGADPGFRGLCDRYGNIAALEWWKGRFGEGSECCTFVEHPYLTADGTIYPSAVCRADDFAVFDAFDKPLAAALLEGKPKWFQLLELSRLRSSSLPACEGCEGEIHCAGGCMGRAHAAAGTFMAVEDRCELRKAVYSWRERREPGAYPDPADEPDAMTRRGHGHT